MAFSYVSGILGIRRIIIETGSVGSCYCALMNAVIKVALSIKIFAGEM